MKYEMPNADVEDRGTVFEAIVKPEFISTEEVEQLVDKDVELSLFERKGSVKIKETLDKALEDEIYAETFAYSEVAHSTDRILTISFSGYGDGSNPVETQATGLEYLEETAAKMFVPREGTVVYFNSPPGIAGSTPDQSIRCTERVFSEVLELIKKYPEYEIKVGGYSAGTYLAHYVANQINLQTERSVTTLYTNATGRDIYSGIATAPPVAALVEVLLEQGYTPDTCTQILRERGFNQEDNLLGLAEKSTKVYATYGEGDNVILPDHPRGTLSQLALMKESGIDVETKAIKSPWGRQASHATLILSLAKSLDWGRNPYTGEKIESKDPNWLQSDLTESYLDMVSKRIESLSLDEQYELARFIVSYGKDGRDKNIYLSNQLGINEHTAAIPALMRPNEQVVAEVLHKKGILRATELRHATVYQLSDEAYSAWSGRRMRHALKTFWHDESTDANTPLINKIDALATCESLVLNEKIVTPHTEVI